MKDMSSWSRRKFLAAAVMTGTVAGLSACSGAAPTARTFDDWAQVSDQARGQTVKLWMYGGDQQGNTYIDQHLVPAAAEVGVKLERVPVADTKDAMNRVLSEVQAGTTDGAVDLVWVNGDNFGTGKQAGAWACGWTSLLPNMALTAPQDPLLTNDFGTPVEDCEAPWNKAQFTVVYNAATVERPPGSIAELLQWARKNPGRFTYPAPPDFTGSVFTRQVLNSVSGGYENVPLAFDRSAYEDLTPALFDALSEVAPALWREGRTYPKSGEELNALFADGQVDFTMTYGPATLTKLVKDGTYPPQTTVLELDGGTLGNASFLAVPATSGNQAGAMVVANIALSAEQQATKADPRIWGQFPVVSAERLDHRQQQLFEALPTSSVVPAYEVLSRKANPELSAEWVSELDQGWRRELLGGK